jgi:hypothetical protein
MADITGIIMELKLWTSTSAARQPLEAINPTWSTQEYRTYHDNMNPDESKTFPCGNRFTLMWADKPVNYALDSQQEVLGTLYALACENETHTLAITALPGSITKITILCVD